jgi:hypothetical protein
LGQRGEASLEGTVIDACLPEGELHALIDQLDQADARETLIYVQGRLSGHRPSARRPGA